MGIGKDSIIPGLFTPMEQLVAERRQRRQAVSGIKLSVVTLKDTGWSAKCPFTQLFQRIYVTKMGIRSCSAINCSNNSKWNKDLSFFSFPKDPKRWGVTYIPWVYLCFAAQKFLLTTCDLFIKYLRCLYHWYYTGHFRWQVMYQPNGYMALWLNSCVLVIPWNYRSS